MKTRRCSHCKRTKRTVLFYGEDRYCSKCRLKYHRSWMIRTYGTTNIRKTPFADAVRKRDKKWHQIFRKNHPGYKTKEAEDYRKRHPGRWKVYIAVYLAVKQGKLKRKPCVKCGAARVHAHHEDYKEPFRVVWLCSKHHAAIHQNGKTKTS